VASSGTASQSVTSVYGLDAFTWRRFKSWCQLHGVNYGAGVAQALDSYMQAHPALPGNPDSGQMSTPDALDTIS